MKVEWREKDVNEGEEEILHGDQEGKWGINKGNEETKGKKPHEGMEESDI